MATIKFLLTVVCNATEYSKQGKLGAKLKLTISAKFHTMFNKDLAEPYTQEALAQVSRWEPRIRGVN